MKRVLFSILPLILMLAIIGCAAATVSDKKFVTLNYKGLLADGSVFSQSTSDSLLEFIVGANKMMPAFEKGIMGLKVGDKKTIQIKAADAYGEYDPAALQDVPKDQFPADATLTVGQHFTVQTQGGTLTVTIAAIKDKTVTVDFNPVLAGKDLTFEIEIVKIRDATKAELAAVTTPEPPAAVPQ